MSDMEAYYTELAARDVAEGNVGSSLSARIPDPYDLRLVINFCLSALKVVDCHPDVRIALSNVQATLPRKPKVES